MPRLRRIFILSFIIELAGFAIISSLPIHNPALYSSFKSQDHAIVSQSFFPMWLSIFPHNLLIATIEFIPVKPYEKYYNWHCRYPHIERI